MPRVKATSNPSEAAPATLARTFTYQLIVPVPWKPDVMELTESHQDADETEQLASGTTKQLSALLLDLLGAYRPKVPTFCQVNVGAGPRAGVPKHHFAPRPI